VRSSNSTILLNAVQVRSLLAQENHEVRTTVDLSERAQAVLQEAEAACSPASAQMSSGAGSLTESPEQPTRSPPSQALPAWRSHGLTSLLRSLQSEFEAAEKALAIALEQQASGISLSHEGSAEWSISAMREGGPSEKFDMEMGSSQALAKLSQCLAETCEATNVADSI